MVLGSSIFSFTLILLAFPDRPGRRAPPCSRAGSPAHAAPGPRLGRCCTWRSSPPSGCPTSSPTSCPSCSPGCCPSTGFGVDADPGLPVRARLRHRPAGDAPDGRRVPADRAGGDRRTSTPSGATSGGAYALNTLGAIIGSFLSGFVVLPALGPGEGHLRRGAGRAGAGRRAVPGRAPAAPPPAPGWAPRAAVALALLGLVLPALGPGEASPSGFFRVSIAQDYIEPGRSTSATGNRPSWSSTRTASPPPSRSIAGARPSPEEQRQGRRLERRRHADPDHRRPAAVPVPQPAARRPRSLWSATARA